LFEAAQRDYRDTFIIDLKVVAIINGSAIGANGSRNMKSMMIPAFQVSNAEKDKIRKHRVL
jgi:hypothetical protein